MTPDQAPCPPCDSPPKPEGRSARKRRQILEAARALFVEHGFAATSVDMVVERAGVSKPTLYGHFGGKADLFAAVVQAQAEEFASHGCALAQRPPAEGLRALAVMYLDMVTGAEALQLYRAVVAEGHNFPQIAEVFYEAGPQRVHGMVEHYLRDQHAKGTMAVPCPKLAAGLFLGMLRVAFDRAVFGLPLDGVCREAAADEAVRLMLEGYGTHPAEPRPQPQRE
ncbi:MAG: TetR/AcrR family transcriptional regulator [Caenispirillum bisanense]|nr:TetR/AcrR family transcriptional regulator [Caenispirillum bisanense]MCA1972042.1 TetR/AcrR family transcriptional regulator [Caenispirillum sp.]